MASDDARYKPLAFFLVVVAVVTLVIAGSLHLSGVYYEGESNEPPVADAGGDRTVGLGRDVVFDGSRSYDPDGYIVSYLWDFGDGAQMEHTRPTHVFTSLGDFTVTLTVTDFDGARSRDRITVTVVEHLPAELDGVGAMVFGDSAVITWHSSEPGGGFVRYSSDNSLEDPVTVREAGPTCYHSVTLFDLEPGVRYWYKVGVETTWGETCEDDNGTMFYTFTAGGDSYGAWFGITHGHTQYSDGVGTPEDAYTFARDTANIDFLELSDHGYMVDPDEWRDTGEMADRFDEDGVFAAMRGYEWSHRQGHMNVHDTEAISDKGDYTGLDDWYDWLNTNTTVPSTFNHPEPDWQQNWNDFRWTPEGDAAVSTIEVGNGKRGTNYESRFIEALDANWHVAPVYGQDNHDWTWGAAGTALTGIISSSLTRQDVYNSYSSMRVFAVWDRMVLVLLADGQLMGGTVANDGDTSVRVIARDVTFSDEAPQTSGTETPEKFSRLELFLDGEIIRTVEPGAEEYEWELDLSADPGSHYLFVKAHQEDGDVGYSAPVWLEGEKDLRVLDVESPRNTYRLGDDVKLTARLYNQGDAAETVEVTFAAGATTIGTETVELAPGKVTAVSMTWTASGETGEVAATATIASVDGDYPGDDTAALPVYLLDSDAPHVALDLAHDNDYASDMLNVQEAAGSWGMYMTTLTDPLASGSLDGVDVLVMTLPGTPLTAAELDVIDEFATGGGAVLLTGASDYSYPSGSDAGNALLEAVNSSIRLNDDEVLDYTDHDWKSWSVILREFPGLSAGILEGVDSLLSWGGCSLVSSEGGPLASGGGVTVIATGDDDTYGIDGDDGDDRYEYGQGSYPPLFAVEDLGAGRVAVFSSVVFSDYQWGGHDHENREFTRQVLEWLAGM